MRIGIDSGGTFTDFVVLDETGTVETFKLRSNPENPGEVILAGIARVKAGANVDIVHGSTVATNALLERKGARTAFVTTAGFEDLLTIARQARPELYNLNPAPRRELVSDELRFGVRERMLFDGSVLLKPSGLAELTAAVKNSGAESIAICLLHSYANPAHEEAVRQALEQIGYCSASHLISPEFREYERASTTVLNAYVGPLMNRYLGYLEEHSPFTISVMQSNGGFLTASEARREAVRTILSGPAGGVVGAAKVASADEFRRALTFDMGGTSTDVSLTGETLQLTTEGVVDGMPVRIPMLDIHTVGAGGGSLARVDEGGRLVVGPESAGARPGPACYGTGTDATVTDAHVVLGRISAERFLGGAMKLHPERSKAAIQAVAGAMGCSLVAAALGILRIANANMERAIRVVSIERGEDPREFPLVAFGGCGGLHACEMAAELGIGTVLVPEHASVLSALGMLLADRTRDYSVTVLGHSNPAEAFATLEERARHDIPGCTLARSADMRYGGQSYELTVPWNMAEQAETFHAAHQKIYGFSDKERPTETVVVRVRATLERAKPTVHPPASTPAQHSSRRVHVSGKWRQVTVMAGAWITEPLAGPALIESYGSTTLVPLGWTARRSSTGNLILTAG